MAKEPRLYAYDPTEPLDPIDLALADIRCGVLRPGDPVVYWDKEDGRYYHGLAVMHAGNPSVYVERRIPRKNKSTAGS